MKIAPSIAALSAALLIAGLVQAAGPAPQAASAAATAPSAATATAPTAAAPLSLAELHQRLVAAGYRDITELQRKRGQVEAEARDRDGRRVELTLDPGSAALRRSEPERDQARATPAGLDLGQLLARVEAAGYRAVSKIEHEGDTVEVRAEDAQGQRVKLRLDPLTGALLRGGQ